MDEPEQKQKKGKIINHYDNHAELPRVVISFVDIDCNVTVESCAHNYDQALSGCYELYKKIKRKPKSKYRDRSIG